MNLATVMMGTKGFMSFKIKGKETDDMLLVTVHPEKQFAQGKGLNNPVTFTPGRVTRLAEALEAFGQPTETQLWSSKPAKNLGLDGLVYWWGEASRRRLKEHRQNRGFGFAFGHTLSGT